ncbi:hypothetical protein Sru01_62780 [Sphaerisporangium rufum]|uniref:TRASH domain-containing protein n=1 Tax=Sphaerisporangium rufum TaxID=1381558 RepID=A0A919V1P7_9ACTN|nr:YHS domain protein [Sphaerisporangium rufum]GII81296.1 hypothetical protein Sru01_62780 [Sphaerisporangium rufum]
MLFIEVLVPKGAIGEEERRRIAAGLTATRLLADAEGHATDPGVMEFMDSLTDVVVREADTWYSGGVPLGPGAPPRYVVNVHSGAWGKEMSETLITRITERLAGVDGGRDGEPDVLVNVLPVPQGSYGFGGRVRRASDLLELIEQATTGPAGPVPDGMVVDPVCGATVPRADAVILEAGGETFGFCCAHCRGHFVKRRARA